MLANVIQLVDSGIYT